MPSKFKLGDRVKVVRVDHPAWRGLIGFTGTVTEVEKLRTSPPQYNYDVEGQPGDTRYLNEYMLEKAE